MAVKRILDKQILDQVRANTHYSKIEFKKRIERAKLAESDELKEKRLDAKECKFCFYFRNNQVIAGQAFTRKNCELCRSDLIFATTHTNKICFGCAIKHHLCAHCLSENELPMKFPQRGASKSKK